MEVERLEKIKIHELAKKLGVETKKVLDAAKQANIDAKSHLSSITEEEANKLEKLLKGVSKTKSMENKKEKNDGPVIIRRAVIINDEEEKKEERRKKEQSRKKDVGFIENNRNKDYNIVYRDKPTKPLTVSELLGIGKKKEPEEKPVEASKKVVQEKEQEVTPKQEEKVAEAKAAETSVSDANNTPVKPAQESKPRFENKKETNYNNKPNYKDRNENNGYNNKRNFNNDGQRNNFNNRKDNGGNNRFENKDARNSNGQRRLDDRGIDKKIKNIMDVDIPAEKENVRDYGNKAKDKAKQNRQQDEQKAKKNRRNNENDFDSDKLNNLKKQNKLSNMFQEGEMLDYYDLSTERGRRGKKKNIKQENRTKQKIFINLKKCFKNFFL